MPGHDISGGTAGVCSQRPFRSPPTCAWVLAICGVVLAVGRATAGEWTASVQATSDYVLRGLSETRGEAAPQGGVQYESSANWFAGIWLSTVRLDPHAGQQGECDLYAGRVWALAPRWSIRVLGLRYLFPEHPPNWRYDYSEVVAELDFNERVRAAFAWAPDLSGYSSMTGRLSRGGERSVELSGRQPLASHLDLLASAGYYDTRGLFGQSYWAYGAGMGFAAGPATISLMRFDTSRNAVRLFGDSMAGSRWAATLTWRF